MGRAWGAEPRQGTTSAAGTARMSASSRSADRHQHCDWPRIRPEAAACAERILAEDRRAAKVNTKLAKQELKRRFRFSVHARE